MKKKLFLVAVMVFAFVLALTVAVSAEAIHNSTTVDYDATVTLNDGTVLPLYDENNEALIWYISGTKEDGKNAYSSIRADDSQVLWHTKSWGEVTGVSIVLTSGATYNKTTFVVVNMMDDDVVSNFGEGGHTNLGKAITGFKWVFDGCKNLEYAYLRLDTDGIYQTGFQGCSKLKYINLEDLTKLKRLGNTGVFNGCTSLFSGQVLDLSKTTLEKIDDGENIFKDVPIKGIILPETFWRFTASNTFKDCTSLETVILDQNISQVGSNIFNGCTALRAIFFVGTEEKLDTFIANAEAAGSNEIITGATKVSYTAYKALSSEAKATNTYIVYDYSWCDAYNSGIHGETTTVNACVGICSVCNDFIVNHVDGNTSISITYSSYEQDGIKTTTCLNESCTHTESTSAPALFTCLGFSVPSSGKQGIVIGFLINSNALAEYKNTTQGEFSFGVFAVLEQNIGTSDVIDANGVTAPKTICAELDSYDLVAFDLVVIGFGDDQKDIDFAMGAYVIDGDKVSYLQARAPQDGAKYYFASYNTVLDLITTSNS